MASTVETQALVPNDGSRLMPGLRGPGTQATTELQPQQSSINWVQVALNRLPLILIGLVAGVIGGFFYHLRVVPTYQSTVHISVAKKRDGMTSGMDARFSYLDDFVAVQLAVIKSPQVIEKACEVLDIDSSENSALDGVLSSGLEGLSKEKESSINKIQQKKLPLGAATKSELAALIHSGLTVTKDEKIGVVVLTFKTSRNQSDSPKILTAIIKGYQKFLEEQYGDASDRSVQKLDGLIAAANRELSKLQEDYKSKNMAIKSIHPTGAIKAYELLGFQKTRLESNLAELKDRQEELSARYGGKGVFLRTAKSMDGEGGALFLSADENTLNTLLMEKKIMLTMYGKDHPKVRKLDLQVEYITEVKKNRMANSKGDKFSSEDPYEREKEYYSAKIAKCEAELLNAQNQFDNLKDDAEKEKELDTYCKELSKKIESFSRKVELYEDLRSQTVLTKDHGGYDAKQISKIVGPLASGAGRLVYLFVGGILGVGAGFGLAYLAEVTDRSFQTPDEIRKQLGHPILGHIPTIRVDDQEKKQGSKVEGQLCTWHKPKSTEAEAYRGLRTGLYFSTQNRGHQVIQITSPNAGDGKSTLSGNLSISIAQSGKRIVLIDADMRKPRVHKIFGLENQEKGLSTLIEGKSTIPESTLASEIPNLFLIPCGPRPANPAELLTSPRFAQLLEELRQLYDIVIVDTPPLLGVSDPCVVAPRMDGVILNILLNKSARSSAMRACEMLAGLDTRVLGVVVNCFDAKMRSGAYGYSYSYGYKYSYKYGYRYGYGYNYGYSDYAQYSDDPEGQAKQIKGNAQVLKGPK